MAAIGAIMMPALVKSGYRPATSAGMLAAGGALGPIIPPSVVMIVYGSAMGISIPKMFIGGIIPGIIIMILFIIVNMIIAKKEGIKGIAVHYTYKELAVATWGTLVCASSSDNCIGRILRGVFHPDGSGHCLSILQPDPRFRIS